MRVKLILNPSVCLDIMAAACTSLGVLADSQRVLCLARHGVGRREGRRQQMLIWNLSLTTFTAGWVIAEGEIPRFLYLLVLLRI